MTKRSKTIEKIPTPCCALMMIKATENINRRELHELLEQKKEEADSGSYYDPRLNIPGGQRAMFCIVSPGEWRLKEVLEQEGFKSIATFSRRTGYPDGNLTMYFKSW